MFVVQQTGNTPANAGIAEVIDNPAKNVPYGNGRNDGHEGPDYGSAAPLW